MGNDEVKYVSEDLFKETTNNLSSAVESLTQRVQKVIDDHEERLRDQQEQIRSARDGILEKGADVERGCERLEEHEGEIFLTSHPGKGTTVKVVLPVP